MRLFALGILFVFFTSGVSYAQLQIPVTIDTKNAQTEKKEAGVIVKIMDGSTVVQTYTSDNSGKLNFTVPAGKKYKVEFSKAGKVTRYMSFDLRNVVDELIQGKTPSIETNMSMFDENPNVDFSYLKNNPATEYFFDPATNANIQADMTLAMKTKKAQDKIKQEIQAKQGQSDAQYSSLIKQAAAFESQKKYPEALKAYEDASALKPEEKLPADKIVEIDAILKAQKNANAANEQLENDYKNLITAGNTLRDQGKYQDAIAKYQEALTKKQEQYPKDEIAKCNTLIANAAKEAENKSKYDAAMKAGDGFYTQKSWMAAKDKYKEALKWKANDPAATAKLAEIEGKLNAQKAEQENQKRYNDANDAGDALLAQQKYAEAKAKYNEALVIQPAATYPVEKINECDNKLAEIEKEKNKAAQIEKLLSEGNTAFTGNQLPGAKLKYQEVLKLDAANTVATGRITEIDAKLAEEKANAEKYAKAKQLVTEGDALAKANKHPEAKSKYAESLTLKSDPAVQAKIDAIDALIASAAQKAEQKQKFDKAIQEGDAALAANDFEGAKTKYGEAGTLDPASVVPKQKLTEVEKRIAANKAAADKAANYTAAFQAGNAALTTKDYAGAKAKFQEAVAIDGTKQEAKDKLAEVQKIIDTNAATEAAKVKYDAAVKAGTDLQTAGKLVEAKTKFQEAAKLDPAQSLPAEKIKEIDAALQTAEKQKQVNQLVAEGNVALSKKDLASAKAKFQQVLTLDPGNTQASDGLQKVGQAEAELAGAVEKKAKIDALKAEAATLMAQSKYAEAKLKFTEAKAMQPDAFLDQKIAECDAKIAEAASAAEKNKKYADAVTAGNDAFAAKDYTTAKAKYQEAIAIDNSKQEAKDKYAQVEKLLVDSQTAAQNKIKYDAAIQAGNDLQAAGKLAEAKAKFQEAAKIDPSQALPTDKIREIDTALQGAEKQKQLTQLLSDAATASAKKDYTTAKAKFQQALVLDPGNAQANQGLQEVVKAETAMAGEAEKKARFESLKAEGLALMSQNKWIEAKQKLNEAKVIQADVVVDQKIVECDAKLAELAKGAEADKKYNEALGAAKTLEAAKNYDQAIAKYNEALTFKNAQEPKDRIAAINAEKAAESNQAKLTADFNAAVKKGDDALALKDYPNAIKSYDQALAIKQDPSVVAKRTQAENDSKNSSIVAEQEQYQKILAVGQKAIDEKNYEKAKEMYNRALTFRANDPFPKQKLAEIETLQKAEKESIDKQVAYTKKIAEAEVAAKANKYENAIALFEQAKSIKPDETLPDNRITELRALLVAPVVNPQNELDQKYQTALNEGNSLAAKSDYKAALTKYQDALAFKPNDKVAQDKVSEMKQVLDDLANAEKKKTEVNGLLAAADKLFDESKWSEAKSAYEKVLVKDGANAHAIKRAGECDKKMIAARDVEVEKEYRKIVSKGDENLQNKSYKKAKELYNRALTLRPADPYPKQKLAEIEALMKPKSVNPPVTQPIVTQPVNPPVAVNTTPEELPSLGTETDNSLIDAQKRLEQSARDRKNRIGSRFQKKANATRDKSGELIDKQIASTTESNQTLAEIGKQNEKTADSSDIYRQENVAVIDAKENEVSETVEASDLVKNTLLLNQKDQLNLAVKTSEDQNGLLDGESLENAEILKKEDIERGDAVTQAIDEHQKDKQNNDQQFMNIKLGNEKDAIDDFEERKEVENLVKDANRSVEVKTEENQQQQDQEVLEVENGIRDASQVIDDKTIEDVKQSPVNKDELILIEKVNQGQTVDDYDEHLQNTLRFKEDVNKKEQVIIDFEESTDVQRKENASILEEGRINKDEVDRSNYNDLYEKTLENKGTITTEVAEQDRYAELPSVVNVNNTVAYQELKDGQEAKSAETNILQEQKHQGNQGTLNNTKQVVETKSVENGTASNDNAETLKATTKGLGDTEVNQLSAQKDKNLEARKLLEAIEKKEVVYDEKVANDLGKLYPEGVSQEQFDQLGEDGLVSSVITRRVVVRSGHGDVYIRTQTLEGITYSKNGQPTTETTWQRETQDAKLKRNY